MATLEIPDISTLHANIAAIHPNINVVIQIQSYGRVFVWDQLGLVRDQDHAICATTRFEDCVEDRIARALFEFLQEARKQRDEEP